MKLLLLSALALLMMLAACGGPPPPAAPTNVTATPGSGYITVRWEHSGQNATGFVIYRETVATASLMTMQQRDVWREQDGVYYVLPTDDLFLKPQSPTRIAQVSATERSFQDTEVSPGNTYRYSVAAMGSGAQKSTLTAQIGAPVAPQPVGNPPGENPDPSRYVAVIVKDNFGNAVMDAWVRGALVETGEGDRRRGAWARTDDEGVALLYDFTEQTFLSPGAFHVFLTVEYPGSAPRGVVALFEDTQLPGTIVIDPTDSRYVDVIMTVTDGGSSGRHPVQFVPELEQGRVMAGAIEISNPATLVRVQPANYELVLSGWESGKGFHFWESLEVSGPTNFNVEVSTLPTFTLNLNHEPGPGSPAAQISVCPWTIRENFHHRWSYCLSGPTLRFTPQQYNFSYSLSLRENGARWGYSLDVGEQDLTPAGASKTLTTGGPLTLTIAAEQQSYAPGDRVTFTGHARDSYGHDLRSIWSSDRVDPILTVTDPSGQLVHSFTEWPGRLFSPHFNGFALPAGVAAGTYTVAVTWDTGPYQGVLRGEGTFTVTSDTPPISACPNPDEVVNIPDLALEAAVRAELNIPVSPLLCRNLEGLMSLNAAGQGIQSLTGLEWAVNLTSLELWENQISDLTPLANLTNLMQLWLSLNQISDLTPLTGLTNLTRLSLGSNQIIDLTPLAGLTNLTELRLEWNQISDLTPLTGLTNLTWLELQSNQISDLTALTSLTNLTELWLGSNQISDLAPLANLTNLTHLGLAWNQISDLTPLASLTNLTELGLEGNQISDLTPLAGLTNLTSLSLGSNRISDIAPLVANPGLGSGDWVSLDLNCLDLTPGSQAMTDINTLLARGVQVSYESQSDVCP